MPINFDAIETIKSRISISSLVSRYLPVVTKSGRKWVVCPFHEDRNPSMLLNDERGSFYCFGCQTKGNIFDFLMLYEHLTFRQALEKLAGECHVQLRPETEEDRKARGIRDQIRDIHTVLAAEYMYQLNERTPSSIRALETLERRGVDEGMRKRFLVGYAPPAASFTLDCLRKRGFSEEAIWSAGLFSAERRVPYFRDRIMFPILDLQGRPIAFSGRRMAEDPKVPKYINSSETAIFRKGEILFGMHQALDSLRKGCPCVLVEGNFDVISMHAIGITGAVASCGTALTEAHVELISRHSRKAVVFFDADAAGEKAAISAIYGLTGKGIGCSIARLSGYKDASEALEAGEEGVEAIRNAVDRDSESPEAFLLDCFRRRRDGESSIGGKSGIIAGFARFFTLLESVDRYELSGFLSRELSLPRELVDGTLVAEAKKIAEENAARGAFPPLGAAAAPAAGTGSPLARPVKDPSGTLTSSMDDDKPLYESDLMKMLVVRREFFRDEAMSFVNCSDLRSRNGRILFQCLAESDRIEGSDEEFLSSISDEESRRCAASVIERFGPEYRSYSDADALRMIDGAVKRIVRARIKSESRGLSALSRVDGADRVLMEKNRSLAALGVLNRSIADEA